MQPYMAANFDNLIFANEKRNGFFVFHIIFMFILFMGLSYIFYNLNNDDLLLFFIDWINILAAIQTPPIKLLHTYTYFGLLNQPRCTSMYFNYRCIQSFDFDQTFNLDFYFNYRLMLQWQNYGWN